MIRRIYILPLLIALTATLFSCSKTSQEDTEAVTILVPSGASEAYFSEFQKGVKDSLGIDLEILYQISTNSSGQTQMDIENGNMQADIVCSSMRLPDKHLQKCAVDFMTHSHLTQYFTYMKQKEITADDGGIYQLPMVSRLIGITYNATLMEEHGWQPPKTFQDMLNLKHKCDQAGILFSVTDIENTGGAFNYFFHLMGAQWITTVQGTKWFNDFLENNIPTTKLKNEAEYFRKWVDAGLFGMPKTSARMKATDAFAHFRALFCFNVVNGTDHYDGPLYDRNGKPTETILHDQYKSIPWISEYGNNNCFTCYDELWVTLNNKLLQPGQEERLKRALSVLEFFTTKHMITTAENISKDVFINFINFNIDPDRIYSGYADDIKSGFLQPWYYVNFPLGAIITETGAEISSYMLNSTLQPNEIKVVAEKLNYPLSPNATFNSIFTTLNNSKKGQGNDLIGTVDETLNFQATARLAAIGGAYAIQEKLDKTETTANRGGIPIKKTAETTTVEVALMPYVEQRTDVQPWRILGVQNAILYPGDLHRAFSYIAIPNSCYETNCAYMTGKMIQQILNEGYDLTDRFINKETGKSTFDKEHYGPYQYVCVTKGNKPLDDDKEYLVAFPTASVTKTWELRLVDEGRLLMDGNSTTIYFASNTQRGLERYLTTAHTTPLTNNNINWE